MAIDLYKVAIFFYMVIAIQVQPEFKHDHNHEHHHQKHPHDHDHDHHRRSEIRKASRIYNGVRTPPGQGKFMALMVKSPRRNYCSAVIITEDMLLTAAHCFDDLSAADRAMMRILPNALPIQIYRDNPHIDHPLIKRIRNFWIHPEYSRNGSSNGIFYDIAILQIGPQPWQLGYGIDSALMPVRIRHLDLRVIKGYGYGREVGEDNPTYLNEVNFRYLEQTTGEDERLNPDWSVVFSVSNWSPDANPNNPRIHRHAGPGDSGGGIFIKGSVYRLDRSRNRIMIKTGFVLVGIIVRGSNYSLATDSLTFAVNVTKMMPWINSIVRIYFGTYLFPILSTTLIG